MADINLGASPYNDRFNPDDNRNKVLFKPDRPLQQSELNELQSIAEYNIKRLGDSIFEDGAMQTGMSFNIDTDAGTITINDGLIYVEGKIRPFKKQTIDFASTGTEKLGVRVDKRIIDSNEDPTLLDQTQGVDSYLSSGADRLEEVVTLTYNDESTPEIYTFIDGDLFIEPERPEFSTINEVLAQRTNEESGSYQVEGFKLYTEAHPTDTSLINLVVDPGTAYVLGYRIHKPVATRVPLNKSRDFRSVVSETHTYDSAVRKNKVGSASVKEVTQVIARTNSPVDGVSVTKGGTDGRDALPAQYTTIDPSTVTVWTDSPQAIYTYDTDYTIIQENGVSYVDWNTGTNGTEPTTGTTYLITFEYDRLMDEGVDYQITTEQHQSTPGWDTYVDFNLSGVKPKDGGLIRVNYDFYLARADVLMLNSVGQFTIIEGQPDITNVVHPPEHTDPSSLKIGKVFVYPNTDAAEALNDGVFRLRMEDLQKIKARLEDVEYNQVLNAMESESTAQEDPITLRGVFADGFVDFTRMDPQLSSVALSFDDASITLPINAPADQQKVPQFSSNDSTAHAWGRLVTAPYTENKELSQPLATEAMNVNPYAVYNKLGQLSLTPDADNWIEEDKVTINKEDHESVRLDRWWRHGRDTTKYKQYQDLVENIQLDGNQHWEGQSYAYDRAWGRTGTLTSVAKNVRESAIEYIRQRPIDFVATNLQPNTNNLYLTFDGTRVPVTPTGTTIAGSDTGTIRADGSGRATGSFNIPAGIRTGVREVVLQNDTNTAISTYTAQGTNKTIEEVITKTRVTISLYDPLAQSFTFPADRVVTSFDLYFGSKSSTDNVIVQVRGLSEGGFPNQTVYAETLLKPADVNVSNDGSAVTKVSLDDPLMCKAGQSYCIVIITDSNEYTMWVSTLGQNRIDDQTTKVTTQPYVNGVLFSSSNARTWTVHQESDLKFAVYTAHFEDQAVVEFDPMADLDSNMLLLMASYLTPDNTGCFWEIKTVAQEDVGTVSIDSVSWSPLINYVEQMTDHVIVGLVKLRATFKANRYISPMMLLDDLLFVNFVSETAADYVSLNIDSSESPFNTVTMAYDADSPQGTTVTPKYSLDGGTTWNTFTNAATTAQQSAEYTRYTFTERISAEATNTQIKFKLELRSDNRFVRPRVRKFTAIFKDEI